MTPKQAERVAFIAHGAVGAYRADGVTRYIEHPRRVAVLARAFSGDTGEPTIADREVAAFLHDVLEDTKLSADDLIDLGLRYDQLEIVVLLTKEIPDKPAPPEYYQAISEHDDALVVKCADRCANLEDALAELLIAEPTEPRRWGRYVEKTISDVVPMYVSHPYMKGQLQIRLDAIFAALPAALERRAAVVRRVREAAGLPTEAAR